MAAVATEHLLAISGLNLTLITGTIYIVLIFCRLGQRWASIISIVLSVCYVFVGGAGLPLQRAGWMNAVALGGRILDRESRFLNNFFLAFFVLLVIQPVSLMNVSFQLSFLSLFSLIYFLPEAMDDFRWKETVGRSFAVMLGTFPIVAYYFNVFSMSSLFANMGAIPLMHLTNLSALAALVIGDIPVIGAFPVFLTEFFLKITLRWIHWTACLDWGYFYIPSPALWQIGGYYILFALWQVKSFGPLFPVKWIRVSLVGLWLAVSVSMCFSPAKSPVQLTILSAGKNEIMHIQRGPSRHWLVNTGRGFPSDQAQWIVIPYLRSLGVKSLEGVLLTDWSARRIGGFGKVYPYARPEFLAAPFPQDFRNQQILQKIKNVKTNRLYLQEQDRLRLDEKTFIQILGVVNKQLVFLFSCNGLDFLYLPKVTDETRVLLNKYSEMLAGVELLYLAAGQMNSDNWEYLFDKIDPDWVVASDLEVPMFEYLQARDIALYDHLKQGAVSFIPEPSGKAFQILPFRP